MTEYGAMRQAETRYSEYEQDLVRFALEGEALAAARSDARRDRTWTFAGRHVRVPRLRFVPRFG